MYEDDDEPMNCLKCGVSADDENTGTWTPVWTDGGAEFVGMICGQH